MRALLGVVCFLVSALPAAAHPVAFQGSLGIMGYHSSEFSDNEINYSVRYWMAPSVQTLRFTPGTSRPDMYLGKVNFLLKRWNGLEYQANLYAHVGGGVSRLSGSERGVGHLGALFDIEDRKYYFLAEGNLYRNSDRNEVNWWKVRGGFAPYVTDFDKLHTWFILELNRMSVGERRVNVVPTLRFFYENVLWEAGASLNGDIHLNYIIHI